MHEDKTLVSWQDFMQDPVQCDAEALEIVKQHRGVGLVLTDAVMPEMGGIELLRALRREHPSVKVVMLTGYRLTEDLEQLLDEGPTDWLLKPPNLQRLAQVVAKALGKRVN